MAFAGGDFKSMNIIDANSFSKTYDVVGITSGFGDFSGTTSNVIHTVVSGDTLGTISAKYYGTSANYNKIFEANRSLMGLKGINYLEKGWKLTIPDVTAQSEAKAQAENIIATTAAQVENKPCCLGLLKLTGAAKILIIIGVAYYFYKRSK